MLFKIIYFHFRDISSYFVTIYFAILINETKKKLIPQSRFLMLIHLVEFVLIQIYKDIKLKPFRR